MQQGRLGTQGTDKNVAPFHGSVWFPWLGDVSIGLPVLQMLLSRFKAVPSWEAGA